LKDGDVDELVTGVRAVAAGRSVTPRGSGVVLEARGDLSATVETPAAATMRLLTPREHAVLALVAEGRSNKEIARTLEISEKTVKVHLTNVFRRIGVSDRGAAALWAQEHGLI
jgi:DNA-binding NarL/FixJ family response regulator